MKVLVVVDRSGSPAIFVKGISIIYKLQKNLAKLGVEVHILTPISSKTDPFWREWFEKESEKERIHFHYIFSNINNCLLRNFLYKPTILRFLILKICFFIKILRLNSKYKFDIIHDYTSSPILFRLTGLYKKILKVHTVHTLCTYNVSFFGSFRFSRGISSIDKVICVTKDMEKKLLHEGCPNNKVIHLPLGVDCDRFNISHATSLKIKLNLPLESLVILYLGPIENRKGIFTLAKSAPLILKDNPNVIFVIATSPASMDNDETYNINKANLMKLIRKCKSSFRILEGVHDVPLLMAMADIFILPQTTPHGTLGYPLTLLESMASGKAIAASDTLGVNEVIQNGKSGILFEKGNYYKLAKAINKLLSSEELREKFGKNAKHNVKQYDVDIIAKSLFKLYKEVLEC